MVKCIWVIFCKNEAEMNNILTRIKLVITKTGLSDTAFAKKIDVPQGTLSNMFQRDSMPRADILESISNVFRVNASWLLTGKGEMFIENSIIESYDIHENGDQVTKIAILEAEIEALKKENSEMEAEIRKIEAENKRLDAKNRAISDELLERMRQLVDIQNKRLDTL